MPYDQRSIRNYFLSRQTKSSQTPTGNSASPQEPIDNRGVSATGSGRDSAPELVGANRPSPDGDVPPASELSQSSFHRSDQESDGLGQKSTALNSVPIDLWHEEVCGRGQSTPKRPTTPVTKVSDLAGISTPTRALFGVAKHEISTGKRNADVAFLSPKKDRTKSARLDATSCALFGSPTPPPPLSKLPSSSLPPSSPSVSENARPSFTRDMEIKGSDDEDDDAASDSSFPELELLSKPNPLPKPSSEPWAPFATPKSRRKTGRVHQSPLTIHPKPMFNMKTLLEHQRKEDAILASFERLEEAEAKAREEAAETETDHADFKPSPNTARRRFISVAGLKDDEVAGKALRAMERTEAASAVKNRWYFFNPHCAPADTSEPFPRKAAKGLWGVLAVDGTRALHLRSSLFKDIARRVELPDEILLWALHSIHSEKSLQLRQEYCNLVSNVSEGQIRRLATPELLQQLFQRIGANPRIDDRKLQPVRQVERPYEDRDWAALRLYLDWIYNISPYLEPESLTYAAITLLRMAVDETLLANPDVRVDHQYALLGLVKAVDAASWNKFCEDVSNSLFSAFEQSVFRLLPLLSMSGADARLRQLRQRLAAVFFFDNASLAGEHPDSDIIIREAAERLKKGDYQINRKTDYGELKARVQLLDIALGDGAFTPHESDADHEIKFNADVDNLAQQLKSLWVSIKDSGAVYLSRTEAKSAIDSAQKRLTYQIRTQPPPKESIFDLPGHREQEVVTQRQKDFMDKFIGNLKKPKAGRIEARSRQDGIATSDDEAAGKDETFMTALDV
ncbi:hypothetical protein SODALDRAFT_199644 [Sodiomyces alkalinus F11]|uniref:Uncharacterized protein n=1 Tax=Sodiomyces alkalinus (strain CBS 110278 / VKM F-3762 / F11) TaxID=1314773 RepID=A0A3N2PSP8_SODAK|nr:hypothetical protein SODALDRAFT_199644 [Sodiomyces alkalinus F11]ROT37549.1 hypothetical protein SODALDRAFT_199644 [Sodiomyces alkalinus F11]